MKKFLPLGAAPDPGLPGTCYAVNPSNLSDEQRIKILEEQVTHMSRTITMLKKKMKKSNNAYAGTAAAADESLNKDGIPIHTVCTGATSASPFLFYLTVLKNGYQVGSKIYESLSAAAEEVSGVRRSGWAFWKLPGGTTLKEAYKDR